MNKQCFRKEEIRNPVIASTSHYGQLYSSIENYELKASIKMIPRKVSDAFFAAFT